MARWLLVILVLLNLIYFAWETLLQRPVPPAASQLASDTSAGGERLVLLGELDTGEPATEAPAPAASDPLPATADPIEPDPGLETDAGPAKRAVAAESPPDPAPEPEPVSPEERVCDMIGPFGEQISARQIQDRLAERDIVVTLYRFSVERDPDYWVHMGPYASRKAAFRVLKELQGEDIDSFLITEGELANGISLGFFSRRALAERVLEQRQAQGYEARIREVPRTANEFWAVFAPGEFSEFSLMIWEEIRGANEELQLRKNYCTAIASAEKLD